LEDEEIEEEKKKYFQNLKDYNDSLINMINKEQRLINIIDLINKEEHNKLFDLLIQDYYTYFMSNNLKKKKK